MAQPNFSDMSPAEFAAWKAANTPNADGQQYLTTLPDSIQPNFPKPNGTESDKDPYAVTAWGSQEYDFVVPSGQRCRMKKLRPEELIGNGLLDKITRLPGLADDQIKKAEGQPPSALISALPSKEDMEKVIEVLDELIPLVVVRPVVLSIPKPDETGAVQGRFEGVVYTDDIELADRIAIMNRATQGVSKMDNFREKS